MIEMDTLGKGVCRCISAEHGDNELELGHDEIMADGLIKKGLKEQNQLEVAIGDGMEFTIHGDMKNNKPKKSKFLNNTTVSLQVNSSVTIGATGNKSNANVLFTKT